VRIFLHHSSVPFASPAAEISEEEVKNAQAAWANAIKSISKTYLDGGDYKAAAGKAAGELYGYGHTDVLFKPTKAAEAPFRPTGADAMSYFVAIAMGTYFFTSAADGSKTKVEYTFGYKKNTDGKVRIFLHHSSVPYRLPPAAPTAKISEEEVKSVQAAWANAIKSISKTYLDGGDYVAAAAKAAAGDAMSYFVGHGAVKNGYAEDAGFAINGGKGWSNVVFRNHQVDVSGDVAIAMGNYFFTSAADGSKTKVEYTFGYKKNADGKVRIFLHHSSVPFASPAAEISEEEVKNAQISEEEVKSAQAAWANAIKSISKTYLDGGDYVAAAAKAAGELYGYGHTDVLFKPTKAAEAPFRPTAADAMSYFVGHKAVEKGYAEDAAVNGGKGWSDVVMSYFVGHK
ncbi:JNK, partial [Symbiodinium sp. KB8]